jgi:hypothetical protein
MRGHTSQRLVDIYATELLNFFESIWIVFGNQTISEGSFLAFSTETHGFASLPRDRFAFIVTISGLDKKN